MKFLKALYFGGSSWSISWLNYVLGPMKCSGKQNLYKSEIEEMEKQRNKKNIKTALSQSTDNKLEIIDLEEDFSSFMNSIERKNKTKKQELQRLKSLVDAFEGSAVSAGSV